jgi:hypothetical protein
MIACFAQQDYDPQQHEHLFRTIHAAFFLDTEFTARGPCWKAIGFQQEDPVADLRGSGLLGLSHLAYFCARYPESATAMRRRQWQRRDPTDGGARSDRCYPWAAVGINLTRMICELFDVLTRYGSPGMLTRRRSALCIRPRDGLMSCVPGAYQTSRQVFWPLLSGENFVNELYCAVFERVDHLFESRESGYMDFPAILAEVKEDVKREMCGEAVAQHSQSIYQRRGDGYYSSPLPLESIRLGLGLGSALAAAAAEVTAGTAAA